MSSQPPESAQESAADAAARSERDNAPATGAAANHARAAPGSGTPQPPGGTGARADSAAPQPAGGTGARAGSAVAALALVLALLASVVAGFLWWQYRQFYVALHGADTEIQAALEQVRAADRGTADRLAAFDRELGELAERTRGLSEGRQELPQRIAELERRLAELPERFGTLERRVDALQGGAGDAREAWIRAEAEYYLLVANTELQLAGRWDNAATALTLADNRLRVLADPAVARVRERIADELLALDSVELPDIEGVVFDLTSLAEQADELPLRAAAPSNYEQPPAPLDDAEPGLSRLWLSVRSALGGIVSIERTDEPGMRLSPQERELARRELVMELRLARMAALSARHAPYEAGVAAAAALLERYFDTDTPAVEGALNLLRELAAVDVAPPRPDISGSLALLRNPAAGNAP